MNGGPQGGTVTGSKPAITVVAMLAALMALMDITIVNVALNDIRAAFSTPIDEIGWVVTGYMMANIVIIPMTGWFQRRFGIRRYYAGSIVLFTGASALCALAWNLPSLAVFRAIQGMGGGAIIPTTQTILFSRYPREQHGMAGALFGIGAVTAPLLGPTFGGYLIEWSSWHWIFLVNVPIGVLAAWLALRVIEEPGFTPSREPVDGAGIALLAVGMATLQYVLEEGNRENWLDSTRIVFLAPIAGIAIITFIVHVLEAPHPVVDLRVFLNRTYSAGTGINFLVGLALFSSNFLFALYCGAVMHYKALDIGRVFMVAGAVQLPLLPIIGRFAGRVDARALLLLGISGVTASMWMNAHFTDQADFYTLTFPQVIRAMALGFIFVPVNVAALSDLPNHLRGNAAGLFNATRELGGSIGTAWMGFVVERGTNTFGSRLREKVYPTSPWVQERLSMIQGTLGAQTWTRELVGERAMEMRLRVQTMILAFNHGFMLATAVFLAAYVMVALLRPSRPGAGAAAAAH